MNEAPLLLVHGLVGHLRVPELLSRLDTRAHAPDLLGYGEQRGLGGGISLPAQVEFLHRYCHDRELAPVHVAGHSVGGAIALLFAHAYPNHVASLVSIEGNFTLNDAFWSKRIAESTPDVVAREFEANLADPAAWLQRSGTEPTAQRIESARSHLEHQPAATIHAMARSVVEVTGKPQYLRDVAAVVKSGTAVQLLAGERSRPHWDVPQFVLDRAPMHVLAGTGHLMTIESPAAFTDAIVSMI